MAKDGTNRGGRRAGAGRKPKALLEKIDEGREATVMNVKPPSLKAYSSPEPEEYMRQKQKAGIDLHAEKAFNEVCSWLKNVASDMFEKVNPRADLVQGSGQIVE